jgi:cell division protein FtsL
VARRATTAARVGARRGPAGRSGAEQIRAEGSATEAIKQELPDEPFVEGGPGDSTSWDRPRHLRVVERQPFWSFWRERQGRILLGLAAGIGVVVAFGLVYLHVILAQNQFRLDRLNQQATKEQLTYEQLRLQVAQLESPQHIISTAEGQLGMHQPSSVTYLTGLPAPAASDSAPASSITTAPAGDANWPTIKPELAGTP